jgi:hypothetical protein
VTNSFQAQQRCNNNTTSAVPPVLPLVTCALLLLLLIVAGAVGIIAAGLGMAEAARDRDVHCSNSRQA